MIDIAREFAAVWGPSLWRASWQGGIVLAAAWAIARWCTFLSPRVVCWVWRLACLKLLVALAWISPIPVALLPPEAPPAPAPVVASQVAPELKSELSFLETDVPSEPQSPALPQPEPRAPAIVTRAPVNFSMLLLPVWLLGVVHCVYRSARQWQTASRLVQTSQTCASNNVLRLYQQEADRLGVSRLPRLQFSAHVEGPILVGMRRPAIILPAQSEQTFEEPELRLMLAHELAHHKRHDLAWNWLPTVTTWLFFFHPLVWLMTRGWSEAQEAACDEALIQRRVARPVEYGRLLLKLAAVSPATPRASLASVGVLGAYRNLERRILTMARVRPFSARRIAMAGAAVLSIGLISVVPWRLVAQEAAPAAPDQPAQLITGTFVVSEADEPANDPAARDAIEKLKKLGASIDSQKSKSANEVLTVGIDPMFQGTGADLKLLDDLVDVRILTVDLRDAKALRNAIEKRVAAKEADAKLLDRPLKDIDAAAIGELKLKRPLAHLAIRHLSDATLTKMAALPECRQLSLSSPVLSAAGWVRLAKLAGGVRTLTLQNSEHGPAADDQPGAAGIGDDALASVSQIGSLKALNLFNVEVTDAGLAHLAVLDKLEAASLARCPKAHGAGLANWKQLKRLTLIETPIDAAGMKAISQLAALEFLLMQPGELVGAEVAPLAALANLQTLNVTTNLFGDEALKKTPLGDAILVAAAALPKLEKLIVAGIGVSDDGLTALKGPQLQDLWLGQLNVTDRGLATLASLKELRNLTLLGKGLTDDSLRHFSELAALEFLRVDHSEIQGTGVASLAKLEHLKAFFVESAPFDDEGAIALAQLPALERLSLTRTQITDKALNSIAKLPKLQSLSLAGNKITFAGLFELRAAKDLRHLEATGLKAPKEEVGKLKQALPGVDVTTESSWFYSSELFVGDDEDDDKPAPKVSGKFIPAAADDSAAEESKSDGVSGQHSVAKDDPKASGERKITITGRATNTDGKPVAGATVYLAPVQFFGGPKTKTAITKALTNAAGEYEFRDFALPLQGDDRVGGYQIYGVAPGLGLAWQGTRIFHDVDRPKPGQGQPADHHPDQIFRNDKLTADLRFGSAKDLRGRLLDGQGKPIAGAKVKVSQCRTLATRKVASEDRYLVKFVEELIATADADGRFAIAGLPEQSVATLQITLPDSQRLFVHASTGSAADTRGDDERGIHVGDIDLKLLPMRVQVLYGDTEKVAKGATVGASIREPSGLFATIKADEKGVALLSLPVGKYELGVSPAKGDAPIEFVSASLPLVVTDMPQEQPTIARIPAGCKMEIEVVDADSGEPIPKIGISYNPSSNDPNLHHFYLAIGDLPQTDKDGKLKLGVEPGKYHVMPMPGPDYRLVDAKDESVEFGAGKTVSLKFKLRKQPKVEGKAQHFLPSKVVIDPPKADLDEKEISKRAITVRGRATNAAGEPMPDVTVYLASHGRAKYIHPPAKTTTNAQGEYELRDFELPLVGGERRIGFYQVYGIAPGKGIAWQGPRTFLDTDRPEKSLDDQVFANDKLVADLQFAPTAKLRGRLLDEFDKPIVGASLNVLQFYKRTSENPSRDTQLLVNLATGLTKSTDAEGRFQFDGLADKTVAIMYFEHANFGKRTLHAAIANEPDKATDADDKQLIVGDVDLKIPHARKVRLQVLYGDTADPAVHAYVSAMRNERGHIHSGEFADNNGIVELSLPPGAYSMEIEPDGAKAPAEFVRSNLPLVVKDSPQEQTGVARVSGGCKLEVEVVDADSEKPIQNVDIMEVRELSPGTFAYAADNNKTDAAGKLQKVVSVGKHRFTASPGPDYRLVDGKTDAVDFAAGETVSLKFKLRKQPKTELQPEKKTGAAELVPARTPEQALARLKELGAQPVNAKQIGVQSGWKGTDADLKLTNDLPDLNWLYVEFDKVSPAGIAEINRKSPLENLILFGLTDAILEKLPRLPACKRLFLVQYGLSPDGFKLLAKRASGLEFLDLSGGPALDKKDDGKFRLTDAGLKQISQIGSLKGLHLYDANVTDDGLSQLAALKSLEEMTLNACAQMHGDGYANLAPIKSLRRLAVFSQPLGGEELLGLAKLTQLETLRLSPAHLGPVAIRSSDVEELANMANLQSLDLMAFDWSAKKPFGNDLLRAAARMKSLRALRLYSVLVDAEGIEALATADNLHELTCRVEFNERSLAGFARLKQLKKLGLQGEGVVEGAVLEQLAKLQPLAALSIAGSGIDDRGLALFGNLHALEKLNLPDSKITGAGLASLDKLTKLDTLTLSNSPFNDAGSKHLSRLSAIKFLDLSKTKITDESLTAIGTLKNLQMLTINNDAITPQGLTQLKDLKRLSYISAEGLAGAKEDLTAMRAALKEVNISTDERSSGLTGTTAVFVRDRNADDE